MDSSFSVRRASGVLLALALALLAIAPAGALAKRAKNPMKGAQYSFDCNKKKSICHGGFTTTADGKYIDELHYYSKCSGLPAMVKHVRIKHGVVSFRKTGVDPLGNKVSYVVKARFASKKRLVGSIVQKTDDCKFAKKHTVAKYLGKAPAA